MPARGVRVGGLSLPVRMFDVVGVDAEADPGFTRHVALAGEGLEVGPAPVLLKLIHMKPPLRRDASASPIHSHGSAGLNVDETLQIGVFIDENESEMEAAKVRDRAKDQYVIDPHATGPDGTIKYRRYSCAGFVIEAYRDAGIDLLTTARSDLPAVNISTLQRQYPDLSDALNHPKFRERFGLKGEGPWNVVLAGYVLNSMARTEAEIRARSYTPSPGDEYFPRRPPSGVEGGVGVSDDLDLDGERDAE